MSGDKPLVVVAWGGALHVWEPHKANEPDTTEHEHDARDVPDVTCAAGARVGGTWWVVWGDALGRVLRADVSAHMRPARSRRAARAGLVSNPEVIISAAGAVRGLALDALAGRVYWSGDGAVRVAALDGRRRSTVFRHDGAEPADLVLHNASRTLLWAERGAEPGVRAAGADGAGLRWLVRRRVRRVLALALDVPAARLYFVDGYYDTLESVSLDGSQRVTHVVFAQRPAGAPRAPTHYVDGGTSSDNSNSNSRQ